MATMVIRQLEAPSRVLRLSGDCAPLRGFAVGTEQRGDVAYQKGRNQGRARLDGSEEMPVEYEFRLRNRNLSSSNEPMFLVGAGAIPTASQGLALLREMCRDSVTVSVELTDYEDYVGYIQIAEGSEPRKGERDVTLTLQPTRPSRFEGIRKVPLAADTTDVLERIRAGWLSFLNTARVPLNVANDQLDEAFRAANVLNQGLTDTNNAIDSYRDTADDGVGLAQSVGGGLSSVRSGARQFRSAFASVPGAMVFSDDPLQVMKSLELLVDTEKTTRDVRHIAAVEQRRLDLRGRRDLVGIHIAVAGEDLRLVCYHAYQGNAAAWVAVAQYNGLTSSIMAGGERVLLPRLDARGVE
jgi:hypothetical protein